MAVTFTLGDGTTTIDLTDITENIALDETAYVPVVATPTGDGSIPPYVTETLPVRIISATYDGYATLMQNLHALQKRAAEYWVDQQQATPVWLTCKLDGETTGRRALVKAVWEVDRRLAEVSDSFDYLLQVTPTNAESAWRAFQRSRFERAPLFRYRPLPIDPVVLKRRLYEAPVERTEDPTLFQLFRE